MDEQTVVYADGVEVGRFDDPEDAENFADVWNGAYPHEPWFRVGVSTPETGEQGDA